MLRAMPTCAIRNYTFFVCRLYNFADHSNEPRRMCVFSTSNCIRGRFRFDAAGREIIYVNAREYVVYMKSVGGSVQVSLEYISGK